MPVLIVPQSPIEPLKGLEQSIDVRRRDDGASIGHRQRGPAVLHSGPDLKPAALNVMARCIRQQVRHEPLDQHQVSVQDGCLRRHSPGVSRAGQIRAAGRPESPRRCRRGGVPSQVTAVAAVLPATVDPASTSVVAVSYPSDLLKAEVAAKGAYNGLLLGLGAVALLVGRVSASPTSWSSPSSSAVLR
jgi:hypothetical protein